MRRVVGVLEEPHPSRCVLFPLQKDRGWSPTRHPQDPVHCRSRRNASSFVATRASSMAMRRTVLSLDPSAPASEPHVSTFRLASADILRQNPCCFAMVDVLRGIALASTPPSEVRQPFVHLDVVLGAVRPFGLRGVVYAVAITLAPVRRIRGPAAHRADEGGDGSPLLLRHGGLDGRPQGVVSDINLEERAFLLVQCVPSCEDVGKRSSKSRT